MAEHVLRDAVLELLDEVRSLGPRADDGHVAAQHVPELRQLVDVEAAQQPADPRRARVVVTRPDRAGVVLGADVHRAELVDVERLAVEPHPLLLVEHGPRGRLLDEERDEREERREGRERARRNADVDGALQDAVEAAQRHVVEADDRDAVEVLEPRAQRDELQQVGDDVDVDAGAVGRLDQAEHLDVLVERQRHIQVVDVLAADDVVRLLQRAELRDAAVADVIAAAIVEESRRS